MIWLMVVDKRICVIKFPNFKLHLPDTWNSVTGAMLLQNVQGQEHLLTMSVAEIPDLGSNL